jgi:hypothetical protein
VMFSLLKQPPPTTTTTSLILVFPANFISSSTLHLHRTLHNSIFYYYTLHSTPVSYSHALLAMNVH